MPASTHSERAELRARIAANDWIPLRGIARSFSGLSNEDARVAYVEAVAAAGWIEARTTREQRAQLLARIGQGFSIDQALHEILAVDTDGLDHAVREEIRAEFPEMSGEMAASGSESEPERAMR